MRSLLALAVPVLLFVNLVACAGDEPNEPAHNAVQNQLVQQGGACSTNADCASSVCDLPSSIGTRGLPAPTPEGEPIGDDDDDNANNDPNPSPTPDPNVKGKPLPAPSPNDRG